MSMLSLDSSRSATRPPPRLQRDLGRGRRVGRGGVSGGKGGVERGSARARRGWTLAELLAGLAVFSALLLTVIPLVIRLQRAQPGLGHRQQALLTASSLLDELVRRGASRLPVGDWPASELPGFAQSEPLGRQIPGVTTRVWVEDQAQPPARRVAVEISWPLPAGQPRAQVRLSAWVPGDAVGEAPETARLEVPESTRWGERLTGLGADHPGDQGGGRR